jgi:CheY-like chemotaxis protein
MRASHRDGGGVRGGQVEERRGPAEGLPDGLARQVRLVGPVPCQRFFREQDGTAIVVVSAVEAMDAAIEAGADASLRKPIDPLQLVSTVRDLLRSSALLAGRSSR